MQLRVFTCTKFTGIYPVGTSAVIVARDKRRALTVLNEQLVKSGLLQHEKLTVRDIETVDTDEESCTILNNGDY